MGEGLLKRGHTVRILYRRVPVSGWGRLVYEKLLGAQNWLSVFSGEVATFGDLSDCGFGDGEIIVTVGMSMSFELRLLESLPNPKVQYIHGASPFEPELMRSALSLHLPKIVVGSYLMKIVSEQGAGEVVAVVPNGVDTTEYFCSLPERERDGVGTIFGSHPNKDPKTVIALAEALRRTHPSVPFRVFSWSKRPAGFPATSYDRCPSLRRARDILSRSLVWVLASRIEGFPAPVLEAMACGCAVVSTDCGGADDIISDGDNGFLVPVGDVEAALNRVGVLLNDAQLREQFQKRGFEAVRRFTWDSAVTQLESALRRAAQTQAPKQ
jgi:glycosyltransferase involved in cell wall biosynthesis